MEKEIVNENVEQEEVTAATEAEETSEGKEKKKRFLGKQKDKKLHKEIESLKTELSELKDKHLRLFAEFDNYKKRSSRERMELIQTAAQSTILSLLPVLDDFDRAKKSADDDNTDEVFSEGVSMVYNKLYNTLAQHGLQAMESNGELFDPELHEAISEIPAGSELKGKIIDTVEKGYQLNEKIIRHAKVVVGN